MLAYISPSSSSPAGSPAGPSSPSLIPGQHHQPLSRSLISSAHVASSSNSPSRTGTPHSTAVSSRKGPTSIFQSSYGDRGSLSAPPSRLPSPKVEAAMAFPSPIPLHLSDRLLSHSPSWKPYRQVPAGSPASLAISGPASRATSVNLNDGPNAVASTSSAGKAGSVQPVAEPRVRRCRNMGEAMSVFEAILMGDATDSSGSSDEDDADVEGEQAGFEMDEERGRRGSISEEAEGLEEEGIEGDVKRRIVAEKYRRKPHRTIPSAASPSVSPMASGRRPLPKVSTLSPNFQAASTNQQGWSKGLATLSSHFSFVVDIPVWSPDSRTDLSSLLQIRDETLHALHHIIDSLRLRGVRATYRLMSISSVEDHGRPDHAPYGCIRIAPFLVPTISKRLPMQPLSYTTANTPASALSTNPAVSPVSPANLLSMRRSTVGPSKDMGMSTSLQPTSGLGALKVTSRLPRPSELSTSGPTSGRSWHDNEGGCGRLSALPGQETLDHGDEDKELVQAEVQAAIERDRNGIPMEGRSFLLAIHGQPALIIT